MAQPNVFDPTQWRSAQWIRENLGVYPTRLKMLQDAGKLRVRLDHTRAYPKRYSVADVKRWLREQGGQPPRPGRPARQQEVKAV